MVKKWYSNGEDLKEHNPKTIDKPRLFKETKSNMKLGIVRLLKVGGIGGEPFTTIIANASIVAIISIFLIRR